MEDSNFSQSDDQAKFIVLPSQEESQQPSQIDNIMTSYLKNLPALQDPDKLKGKKTKPDKDTAASHNTHTEASLSTGENLKAPILVPDSEYESEKQANPSDYISESENDSDRDTSTDKGEVTVIKKQDTDKEVLKSSDPSSQSSFQSKNRSNLGSYDQCEVYKTQSGHAKGDKFQLIACSQGDLFADDRNTDKPEGEHLPVSTPAEHLGSLHLSQQPMLVPETMDESGDAIPPSPEVYGSTPIIIPSSPTTQTQDEHSEGSHFDINAANTLAENSKGFDFGDPSDKEDSLASRRSVTPDLGSSSCRKSPMDLDAALQMSTLVDDDKLEQKQNAKRTKKPEVTAQQSVITGDQPDIEDRSRSPVYQSQEEDVIVIPSCTLETQQPEEQSDGLFLQLTLTQESTVGQKSQANARFKESQHQSIGNNNNKEDKKQTCEQNEMDVTKEDNSQYSVKNNKQDKMTLTEQDLDIHNEGQGHKRSSQSSVGQKSNKSYQRDEQQEFDVEIQDEGQRHKKSSQGSEGQRSNKSSQGRGSGSDRSEKSQRRMEKQLAAINDNPIVVWKEESDTDQFHLSLPKEGNLIHPVTSLPSNQGQKEMDQEVFIDLEREKGQGRMEAGQHIDTHNHSVMSEDTHPPESVLALGEIHTESEPVTQPTFQLQKPALMDVDLSQDTSEQLFTRSSPRNTRTKQRFILEDSDDEETEQLSVSTAKGGKSRTTEQNEVIEIRKEQEKSKPDQGEEQEGEKEYIAQKLDLVTIPDESADATQSYNPHEELSRPETSTLDPLALANTVDHNDPSVKPASTVPEVKCTLVQSSTQTLEPEVGVGVPVDINVVQKVAEYLQSGYTPRSRSSSTCTDLSDLQGSEKSESTGKGSVSKSKERRKSSSSRKDSTDKKSPKSPKEIQEILNTYTSILNRRKSSSQVLSRQTSVADSVESNKDRDGQWVAQEKTQIPPRSRTESRTPQSLTVTPASSVVGAETTQIITPQPNAITPSDNKTVTESASVLETHTPRSNIPARKDLSLQYSAENKEKIDIDCLPVDIGSPKSRTDKDKPLDTRPVPGLASKGSSKSVIGSPHTPKSKSKNIQSSVLEKERSPAIRPGITSPHTPKSPGTLKSIDISKKDSPRHREKHHSGSKHKVKKLKTASDRSERRQSVDSSSPALTSGAFVGSTQKFSTDRTGVGPPKLHKGNTFDFHGTQSQISPETVTSPVRESPRKAAATLSYAEKTPLSSRKRNRQQIRQSRLKKARTEEVDKTTPPKHHVSFKSPSNSEESSDQPVSQKSNVTAATIGSLPSLPSSISSPTHLDYIMSPSSTSSGSRQSVMSEVGSRLSAKRMSLEQALPDTIPLQEGEEENYQLVTVETSTVKKVYTEIITTKKIIGPQGHVLENTVDVKKSEPTIMEETTHKRMQYVYMASPSRSAASCTSGDLADISSSLSKSSVSSGSLGLKVNSINGTGSSSLEGGSFGRQSSLNQSKGQTGTPEVTEKEAIGQRKTPVEASTSKGAIRKGQTPKTSALHTPVIQDVSVVVTPLGSTINKTGGSSYLHSRTTSMESPKASDSLFTSTEEKTTEKSAESDQGQCAKKSVETGRVKEPRTVRRQASSGEETSSEIPYQDQAVSSSSPNCETSLVPSSGVIGCCVMAKWKDGFFYPGTLKSTVDRNGKCYIKFDDGTSMYVKVADILLIEKLPVGQSVMVLTDDGDFVYGLISGQQMNNYVVSKDEGGSDEYTHSQVILSGDQADCIISDAGNQILLPQTVIPGPAAATGAVSLDNLVDAPRRSAKKQPLIVEKSDEPAAGSASTSKGRKRKIDELRPKATSTPTPKGKQEMGAKRRKVMDVNESPIGTPISSPSTSRKSPRKARDRLFKQDIGPIPTKKLFRGMTFLLTNVEKNLEQREFEKTLLRRPALETSTDESSTEDEIRAPFDKDHLKAQIEAGGGVCVDTLDDKMIGRKKCYLVSSSYQRTIKYLQCLACGIPCMSHMWLVDSCTQGQLLDEKSYVLPNGVSLERKRIIECSVQSCQVIHRWKRLFKDMSHDRIEQEWNQIFQTVKLAKSKKDVFIGVKAAVFSKNAKFVETWTQILGFGQCKVNKQLQYADLDVIVTDTSCTPAVKRQATSHTVPLVSTEWVIQSLINSKTMAFDGHMRYKHDYT